MLFLLIQTHHLSLRGHKKAYIAYSSDALNQFIAVLEKENTKDIYIGN